MPVKNAAPWLAATFNSIIEQSYPNWELIAIDDGSTDQTPQLLDHFSKMESRIRWEPNGAKGIIPALQHAYSLISGTFITRMDADDLMPKNKLEVLLNPLKANELAVSTGKVRYFPADRISPGYRRYEHWLNERIDLQDHWAWVYRECVVASPNWMTSRKVIEQTGAFGALRYPEDYHLVLLWYEQGIPIVSQQQVTHLWREHPYRTSHHHEHYQQAAFFELKLEHWLQTTYTPERPLILLGENKKAKITRRFLQQRQIKFVQMGLTQRSEAHVSQIGGYNRPQLLVAVFPQPKERKVLEDLLQKQNLTMGEHYWYL